MRNSTCFWSCFYYLKGHPSRVARTGVRVIRVIFDGRKRNSVRVIGVGITQALLRPRPHVSGDFCIRKFFYADTPSVHTWPPYTLGVSGDFCIRSLEWKFLYTLCIRIRVDARIRFVYATCGRRYFYADTKISGYVWTGPKSFIEYCPKETRTGLGSSSIRKAQVKTG